MEITSSDGKTQGIFEVGMATVFTQCLFTHLLFLTSIKHFTRTMVNNAIAIYAIFWLSMLLVHYAVHSFPLYRQLHEIWSQPVFWLCIPPATALMLIPFYVYRQVTQLCYYPKFNIDVPLPQVEEPDYQAFKERIGPKGQVKVSN